MRRKVKRLFPIDFYGQDGKWHFAVRAENPNEVLDAQFWQSEISCHREKYDLLRLAVTRFTYQYAYKTENSATEMLVKMVGPVVTVSELNKAYR